LPAALVRQSVVTKDDINMLFVGWTLRIWMGLSRGLSESGRATVPNQFDNTDFTALATVFGKFWKKVLECRRFYLLNARTFGRVVRLAGLHC
jgi:hypothetical protein